MNTINNDMDVCARRKAIDNDKIPVFKIQFFKYNKPSRR